jgi:hypothetical protein
VIRLALLLALAAPAAAAEDYEPQADDGEDDAPEEPAADGGEHAGEVSGDKTGIFARRKRTVSRCKVLDKQADGPRRERLRKVEYAASHLGGDHTRRAWKDLVKLGVEGCAEVAAWLDRGGPGGEDADRLDAALTLIRGGPDALVAVGVRQFADTHSKGQRALVSAMKYRHVALDAPSLAAVQAAFDADEAAVSVQDWIDVLTGLFVVVRTYTYTTYVNGAAQTQTRTEYTWYYAPGEPPEPHVDAMAAWLAVAPVKEQRSAVDRIRRRIYFGWGEDSTRWTPVLLQLTRQADEKVVDVAAHALGLMDPPDGVGIADALLADGEFLAQIAYAKGLRSRLKKGRGDFGAIEALERLVESEHAEVARKAKGWAKKLAKKAK